jgi:hypothetical protein
MERAEQRRILQQQRLEAEAQVAAERERLRARRQAEQERLLREQEEMRRAMDEERARLAAERERMAQAPIVPPAPVLSPPVAPRVTSPTRRSVASGYRPAARRASRRDRRFERAALVASIVALLAMLGFAIAMNLHPTSPMPHSMVQNPVQEQSPFGTARTAPATTTVKPPTSARPAAHASLPQKNASPAPARNTAKPSPGRTRRTSRNDYAANDEIVVHHYGTAATQQKHPSATQTRAGVRKYTDQQ